MVNGGTVDEQDPDLREPSASELVKHLSEQVSTLLRDELKLAQLGDEPQRQAGQASRAGLLGGAGRSSPCSGWPA